MTKHVAITGASSGIGAALAREYASSGANVTLVARRGELLRSLASQLPTRSHLVIKDLSDSRSCADWIPGAEAALGPIDVLINNAGVQPIERTAEADPDTAERVLALLLTTPLRLTRAVLPGMIARGHGAIVDVTSIAALSPTIGMTWYAAGKAGLSAASELTRAEVARAGVHVLTVYPGPVYSDLGLASADAFERTFQERLLPWGNPEVLARRIRLGVERRRGRIFYPRLYALTWWLRPLAQFLAQLGSPAMKSKR